MRRRHEVTDAPWARLTPLVPPRKPGKPRQDDRLVIDGILWKLATVLVRRTRAAARQTATLEAGRWLVGDCGNAVVPLTHQAASGSSGRRPRRRA